MFKHSQCCAGMLLIGGLLAVLATESTVSAQQKKGKAPPRPASKAQALPPPPSSDPEETKNKPPMEADKLGVGSYRGLIVSVPNEGGLFRVAVEYPRVRVKPGKEKQYDQMQMNSVKLAAKAQGKATEGVARRLVTPGKLSGSKYGLPDRQAISGSLGMSAGAATGFEGLQALSQGCLETVMDTQTVNFHAAPMVQVRVLRPSATATLVTAPSDGAQPKTKEAKAPLPGYEGALSDLTVGQRVLLTIAPTNKEGKQKGVAPGSVYRRLVVLVVVEEEAQSE